MENEIMTVINSAKEHIKTLLVFSQVLVVIGNETCDLDSAISSLAYSLLLHHKNTPNSIVIPVFNIPRIQLPVKTEVTYFLTKQGINVDSVVCRDEINLDELQTRGSLQLTLVDHHVLQPADKHMVSSVVAVIDHRPPDPGWPWSNTNLTLKSVGSCCTLITQKLLTQEPDLITPSVAILLLGTILLDTACLSPNVDRATPLDHQMADDLQARCVQTVDRVQLFNELQAAKSDISSLTAEQLLIKDLKFAAGIPIVGLPLKVKEFLMWRDSSSALRNFCKQYQTTVCILYGMAVEQGVVTRDISVYSLSDKEAASLVVAALTGSTEPFLDLQPLSCPEEGTALFEQLNIKVTRKHILPLILQVGEKIKAGSTIGSSCKTE